MLTQTSSDVLLSIADDFLSKDDVVSPTRRVTSKGLIDSGGQRTTIGRVWDFHAVTLHLSWRGVSLTSL